MENFFASLFLSFSTNFKTYVIDFYSNLINKAENHYFNLRILELEKENIKISTLNKYLKITLEKNILIQQEFIENFPSTFWFYIFIFSFIYFFWLLLSLTTKYFFKDAINNNTLLSFFFKSKISKSLEKQKILLNNLTELKDRLNNQKINIEDLKENFIKKKNEIENYLNDNDIKVNGKKLINHDIEFNNEFLNLINSNKNKIYTDENFKNINRFYFKTLSLYNYLWDKITIHSNGMVNNLRSFIIAKYNYDGELLKLKIKFPEFNFKEFMIFLSWNAGQDETFEFLDNYIKFTKELFDNSDIEPEEKNKMVEDYFNKFKIEKYKENFNDDLIKDLNDEFIKIKKNNSNLTEVQSLNVLFSDLLFFQEKFLEHYQLFIDYQRSFLTINNILKDQLKEEIDSKEFQSKFKVYTDKIFLIEKFINNEAVKHHVSEQKQKYEENNKKIAEIPIFEGNNYSLNLNNKFKESLINMGEIDFNRDASKFKEFSGRVSTFIENEEMSLHMSLDI